MSLFYRGLPLARLDQLTTAAIAFQQGLNVYPNDKRFPLELAGAAYRQKALKRAKHHLHTALRLDHNNTYGNDFLGTLYLLDQNLSAALKYWNRIGKPVLQNVRFEPEPPLDLLLRERTFAVSGGQMFTLDRLRTTEANLDRRMH